MFDSGQSAHVQVQLLQESVDSLTKWVLKHELLGAKVNGDSLHPLFPKCGTCTLICSVLSTTATGNSIGKTQRKGQNKTGDNSKP